MTEMRQVRSRWGIYLHWLRDGSETVLCGHRTRVRWEEGPHESKYVPCEFCERARSAPCRSALKE